MAWLYAFEAKQIRTFAMQTNMLKEMVGDQKWKMKLH